MDTQVGHRAEGGTGLLEEPCVGALVHAPHLGALVAEGGLEGDDAAHGAGGEDLLGLLMGRGQTLVMADHQALAALLGGGHHGLALLQGDGHRLFAQDVLAGLQGLDADLGMEGVGHTDGDGVDLGIGQQLIHTGVHLAAVQIHQGLGTLGDQVIEAPDFHGAVVEVFIPVTLLGNGAAADDANSQHVRFSFVL